MSFKSAAVALSAALVPVFAQSAQTETRPETRAEAQTALQTITAAEPQSAPVSPGPLVGTITPDGVDFKQGVIDATAEVDREAGSVAINLHTFGQTVSLKGTCVEATQIAHMFHTQPRATRRAFSHPFEQGLGDLAVGLNVRLRMRNIPEGTPLPYLRSFFVRAAAAELYEKMATAHAVAAHRCAGPARSAEMK